MKQYPLSIHGSLLEAIRRRNAAQGALIGAAALPLVNLLLGKDDSFSDILKSMTMGGLVGAAGGYFKNPTKQNNIIF